MKRQAVLLASLVLWLALAGSVWAQSGGGYDLGRWVVPGGGDLAPTGGGYTLMGAAGQPEPGPSLAGGEYDLEGGFWSAGDIGPEEHVFLPILLKNAR